MAWRAAVCYIQATENRPSRRPASRPALSRSPARPGQPQLVGDLLSGFLDRRGLTAKVEAASALTEWAERVGPQIAAVTEPLRVADGTLVVGVATSAWMMELTMMKAELMRRLNGGKTEGRLRQLVFVMQGTPEPPPAGGWRMP